MIIKVKVGGKRLFYGFLTLIFCSKRKLVQLRLSSFCLIGLIGYINDYPWGSYALIFFPWLTATFLTNPKEYTPVSRPFSKRPKSTGGQSENSEVFNHFN
ncbi:MAG: hypothetical protein OXF84_03785 [Bacteroidetes bacterium]|nr:hypothetical protein [Bacteroidota bacterium]